MKIKTIQKRIVTLSLEELNDLWENFPKKDFFIDGKKIVRYLHGSDGDSDSILLEGETEFLPLFTEIQA